MSEHLPECYASEPLWHPGAAHCICDRLRQAERRGFHRGWRTAEAYWRKVSIRYGRRKVQECRDAVAAVEGGYSVPIGATPGQLVSAMRREMLTAIDALRGAE